jgi:hypothetical protein
MNRFDTSMRITRTSTIAMSMARHRTWTSFRNYEAAYLAWL